MSGNSYDVLILGAGNAGLGVTGPTRKAGLSVAIVEEREIGGTCPNRGCTPKKVLVAAAHALHEIERAKVHGIRVGKARLDWGALIDREKQMINHLPASMERSLSERGVEVLRGHAAFVAPDAVRVGDTTIEARHIVIATGSKPRRLPIAGAEHMITSDDVLSERTMPRSVAFVGGGVIALEFAHVYARAGVRVTVLEALPRLLGQMDEDAVEQVRAESERIGITIRTNVKVERIEQSAGRLRVSYKENEGGRARAITADRVVNGAGRVANIDALDLEAAGIAHDGGRIAVDECLRATSNPTVHVCGDPLSSPQLSPVATYEGRIVGRNIAEGARHRPDYSGIPSCVFTVPALASVGVTEAEARQKGLRAKVETNDMRDWLSARTHAETAAWAKLIIDEASDRILGAHLVGHAGEELIHFFALALAHGITATQIRDLVYAFPTYSADIRSMLG
jgi:glutathione reductase (NADPH)